MEMVVVKKQFLIGYVLCVFLLMLVGCGDWNTSAANDNYVGIDYDYINVTSSEWSELIISSPLQIKSVLENNVSMIVIQDCMRENILKVDVFNNSEHLLLTGLNFTVDFFNGTDWMRVPWHGGFPAPFEDVAFSILPSDSINLTKNMNLFEPLIPGLYRLRKNVFIDGSIIGDVHDITAEFYWEW